MANKKSKFQAEGGNDFQMMTLNGWAQTINIQLDLLFKWKPWIEPWWKMAKEAAAASLSLLIMTALYQSNSETSQTQPLSSEAPPLPPFSRGRQQKLSNFQKRRRAQSQISAQVLIWPPNGIIQTQAFITHMNESRARSPLFENPSSKDRLKSAGLRESREKMKTLSRNPPPPLFSTVCLCSHQLVIPLL